MRRAAQALAVAGVAALLGVLVWRVVTDEGPEVPVEIDRGGRVAAPAFMLPRLEGDGKLSLASLRGRAVVLNFWASWCVPCKEEVPLLEDAWREHRANGLVVLGIDIQDGASDARKFARRAGLTYPLVRDQRGKTLGPYNVAGVPQTLFVNRRGRLVGSRIQGGIHLEKNRDVFEQSLALALRG
jgi:cytochrome c biogenesis protein CcmG/thiol:disulfide interchange protein DsbE